MELSHIILKPPRQLQLAILDFEKIANYPPIYIYGMTPFCV